MNKTWKWKLDYLEHHKEYLKKGKYFIMPNMRTIINSAYKKDLYKKFPRNKNGIKSKLLYMIASLDKLKVEKNGNQLQATAVYFSNAGKDCDRVVKFFDYGKAQVLTKCQQKFQFESYLENRRVYSTYFKVPLLLHIDVENLTYTEEIVDKQNFYDLDKKVVLCKIAEIYHKHFSTTSSVKLTCCSELPPFSFVTEQDKNILVPCYLQHGDLSIDNFICMKDDITFIDFEHQGYYTPYYDLFFLIVNTPDEKRRELLISGVFDKLISDTMKNEECPVRTAFKLFALMYYDKRLKQNSQSETCKQAVEVIERIYKALGRR